MRRTKRTIEQLEDRRLLATFTVNDFVDDTATINSCVAPPATLNLRDAVALANLCPGGDTILFTPGQNSITLTMGQYDISDDLIIRGGLMPNRQMALGGVTIDGQSLSRIFSVDDPGGDIDVTLEGMRLQGGNPGGGMSGGAVYSTENLILQDMLIQGNTAAQGGGVFDVVGSGSLDIIDSIIENNYAETEGGGVYASGDIEIQGATISGNTVGMVGAKGGGLFIGGTVNIEDSMISGNSGFFGGGLNTDFSVGNGAPIHIRIVDSDMSGNTAAGGGAMFITSSLTPILTEVVNTTLSGNSVSSAGGAILNTGSRREWPSTLVMSQVTISGNTAADSAAISFSRTAQLTLESSIVESNVTTNSSRGVISSESLFSGGLFDPPELTISNTAIVNNTGIGVEAEDTFIDISTSTISGNSRPGGASGLIIFGNPNYDGGPYDATTLIRNSTIAYNANTSNNEGTIHSGGSVEITLENSIISGNGGGSSRDLTGTVDTTANYTLLEKGATAITGSGNIIGMAADLGPLTTYMGAGRMTMAHPILPTSPVIDQGAASITSGFDQRRYLRVADGDAMMGGIVDMGSFEYGSIPPAPCDLNGDGSCDIGDLNQVSYDVLNQPDLTYSDLNDDGTLSSADVLEWLTIAGAQPGNAPITGGNPFLQGDANLDGNVNGQDFLIWNANKFTVSDEYGAGDFNVDGTIDGQDFLIWNSNKFTSSMRGVTEEDERVTRRGAGEFMECGSVAAALAPLEY